MTVEQVYRVHQALDTDRYAFVTSLPEQVADRLLTYSLTCRMRDDAERTREHNRKAQQRRRARLASRDDTPDNLS
jgi:hypothetical protein